MANIRMSKEVMTWHIWGCGMCDEAWNTLDDVIDPLGSHYRIFGKIWQFGEKQENNYENLVNTGEGGLGKMPTMPYREMIKMNWKQHVEACWYFHMKMVSYCFKSVWGEKYIISKIGFSAVLLL